MSIFKHSLNGCHRRKNLGAVPSSYGKENAYSGGFVTVGGEMMTASDGNVYTQNAFSVDSSGNWFANPYGNWYWDTDTVTGVSGLTNGAQVAYSVDYYGVGSDSSNFNVKDLLASINQLTISAKGLYDSITGSETATDIKKLLQSTGILTSNATKPSSSTPVPASLVKSTNYTPYILGGLGLVALILILRK